MNIKRINELFDSEELKSDMRDEFEIPYLRGDLGKHAATKWKKVSKPSDIETSESFHKKMMFKYPILSHFHEEVGKLPSGAKIHCNYATSTEPAPDGEYYYAQFVTTYDADDEVYYISIIMRNINDYNDDSKWVRLDYSYDTIDSAYGIGKAFLKSCNELGIIKPSQINPLDAN